MLPDDVISEIFSYCPDIDPVISIRWYKYFVDRDRAGGLPATTWEIMFLSARYHSIMSFEQKIELPNLFIPLTNDLINDARDYRLYKFPIQWAYIFVYMSDKHKIYRLLHLDDSVPEHNFPSSPYEYFRHLYTHYHQFRSHVDRHISEKSLHKVIKRHYDGNADPRKNLQKLIRSIWNEIIWIDDAGFIAELYKEYYDLRRKYL